MHKIIIILLFLLVRVFSFLSLYLVRDKIKIVIVASEVVKVETIEKLKNDVRKNTRQKKIIDIEIKKNCVVIFSGSPGYPATWGDSCKIGIGVT